LIREQGFALKLMFHQSFQKTGPQGTHGILKVHTPCFMTNLMSVPVSSFMKRTRFLCFFWLLGCLLLPQGILAAESSVSIDIYGPGQTRVRLYQADPLAMDGKPFARFPARLEKLETALRKNLGFLPFFDFVATQDILGGGDLGGFRARDMDFKKLQLSKVDLVLTTAWASQGEFGRASDDVELRVFETFTGRLVLGKAYSILDDQQVPEVVTRFCAALMKELTGSETFFTSRIAYVCRQGTAKEICLISPQGNDPLQLTQYKEISLSPAWSRDGEHLAFTHVSDSGHRLAVWDKSTGKITQYDLPGHTCIGPAFDADNNLAISIDPFGNPDIYLLDGSFKVRNLRAPLIENRAIDISASFDRQGRNMAFVSSRFGNPHIFMLDRQTGKVTRVTYEGTYNTCPSLSPDGSMLAFARRTEGGHRIFVTDLATGMERQVTFGPGNDEDPVWSPDGYFLAFTSNRTGTYQLYVATKYGDNAKHIPTGPGDATAPAWSPVAWKK
jgi:TolB protein